MPQNGGNHLFCQISFEGLGLILYILLILIQKSSLSLVFTYMLMSPESL